ncbi:hypothetical protein [Victivallis vadensis]|uniref:hypothetical protein n=1 Tax=Victivallis vadensis TaxID=172901 RepID=UPI00307CF02F
MEQILKVGDVIEFNGKKYRAESEVKETPRRHIELGVVRHEGNWVIFKIVEQTHRGNEFCQQTAPDTFKASNGIELASVSSPAWGGANRLYCCGFLSDKDSIEIVCTTSEFAKISEAVSEYNITDGKGYEKPWPQTGDRYFFISGDITPGNLIFTDCAFDHNCQTCCNIFRTYEEAVAAADKIKALLKELAAK